MNGLPMSDIVFCAAVAGACIAYAVAHWSDFFPY